MTSNKSLAKKFQSMECFDKGIENSYQLLPSRFVSLSENRYLLTNEVGEYLIVSKEQLHGYVKKTLSKSSEFYFDLKSKHFLFDDDSNVAIQLLGLKYRTKAQKISQFTALHIFVVSLRCDYSCKYCQVSRQTDDKVTFDMSKETANRSLDFVFKSPSPAIKIEFQGGEPLLNFEIIKYIVLSATELNKHHQKNLQFVITTNLTFLNTDILSFCLIHNIYLSTSLDGSEELHNKNRPRPGKNGYQLTVKGIKEAQLYLGFDKVGALMTTTENSLDCVKEIINEYLALDMHCIFLRPLSPYGFAIKNKQTDKYNLQRWFEFYTEGLEYIIDLNKKGYFFTEIYTQIILSKIFSPFGTSYVDLQSPTGAGISAIVYNYNGDVYASDEARMLAEMGDSHFRLGNVHHSSYPDVMLSDVLLDTLEYSLAESSPMCHECGFLPYCGTDPVYHYATQHDVVGHKALSGFCNKNMKIFRYIFSLLERDEVTKNILLSWVRP